MAEAERRKKVKKVTGSEKKAKPVKVRHVSKAARDRSTVYAYLHFEDLKACLESGWSPEGTHAYLEQVFVEDGGIPSMVAIRKWRDKHMPTARVIPHEFITKKLQGVDYKVDVIKHLSRLIPLLEERVARGLNQEEVTFGGLPLPINDQVVKTYLEALRDWVKVAQDLGLMKAPAPPIIDARTQNVNFTVESARELKVVLEEIKKLGPMP